MILIHNLFINSMNISDEKLNILLIENNSFFHHFINYFVENDTIEIELYNNNTKVNIDKNTLLLSDYLNLDINTTKNLNKLYSHLDKVSDTLSKSNLTTEIINFVNELFLDNNIDFTYDINVNFNDVFKSIGVKFDVDKDNTFIEKLIDFISIKNHFEQLKLFVFVNLKSFLCLDDYILFSNYCSYNKINTLLIESNNTYTIDNESITIIDNDLCVID